MRRIGWEKRANALKQELASIRTRAHLDSTRFQELQRQAECCKVRFLGHRLEARRKSLATSRGAVAGNGKGLLLALGVGTAASVLAGIVTKDRFAGAQAGLSGFDGALQGLGETDWAVCLGRHLAVTSRDNITPGQVWLAWDSVKAVLCELEERARNGAHLGNLDKIISELQKSKRLVVATSAQVNGVATWLEPTEPSRTSPQ